MVLQVVAGAIDCSGRLLLCRRPMSKARGGQWEFPGGKIETGESAQQALERELREELGIQIRAGKSVACVDFAYPEMTIRLNLLSAEIVFGEPQLLEHMELKWATPEDAITLNLCPADRELLNKLMEDRHDV